MNELPDDLSATLTGDDLAAARQWWNDLSAKNRDHVHCLIAIPECTFEVAPRDTVEPNSVDLFGDDWQSNWEDHWQADWRDTSRHIRMSFCKPDSESRRVVGLNLSTRYVFGMRIKNSLNGTRRRSLNAK